MLFEGGIAMKMGMAELLDDYVVRTVKLLVDNPDDVKVAVTVSTKNVIIQIKSLKSDLGKIIGKKGRTIESMKTLSLAIKNTNFPSDTRRVTLEIIEDETSSFLDLD